MRSGAQADVETRIESLMRQSLAALEGSAVTSATRATLHDLATAATQRVV